MNIVGLIVFVASIAVFIYLHFYSEKLSEEFDGYESDWIKWFSYLCVFLAILSGVWLIDTYVVKIPNPFDGPKIELNKEHIPEKINNPTIVPSEKNTSFKEAKEEHKNILEDWERNN